FPLVLVKPASEEGSAGDGLDVLEVVAQGSLGGVEPVALGLPPDPVRLPVVAVEGFHLLDQQGGLTAPPVLRGDPAVPANALVGVGPAVPVDECHVYYPRLRAPIPARSRRISSLSSCSP